MANNRVKVEMDRVLGQNNGAQKVNNAEGFGGAAMRAPGISGSTIPQNSVITIDTDWRDQVISNPIKNAYNDDGSQKTVKNTYVTNVATGKAYPFYPGSLWKSIRSYTVNGEVAVPGEYLNAGGDVIDDLGAYATVDEALDFLAAQCAAGRGIKVQHKQCKTMPYEHRDDIEAKYLKNGSVMQLNWVDVKVNEAPAAE